LFFPKKGVKKTTKKEKKEEERREKDFGAGLAPRGTMTTTILRGPVDPCLL